MNMPYNLLQPGVATMPQAPQPGTAQPMDLLRGLGQPPGGMGVQPQQPGQQPGTPPGMGLLSMLSGLAPGMLAGGGLSGLGALGGLAGGMLGNRMLPPASPTAEAMRQPPMFGTGGLY